MGTLVKYIELFPIPMMKTKARNSTKVIANDYNHDEDSPLLSIAMSNKDNKDNNNQHNNKKYYNKHSYLHDNSIFISFLKNDNHGRSLRY